MKILYFLILIRFLISCKSPNKQTDKTSLQKVKSITPSPISCYRYASATDTIILKLIHVGNSITGTLVYILKEKDRNNGTIQGNMKGNILLADYTFMSEGVQSIRQVVFKKQGNFFIEGYGDFKNIDSLNFNTFMKLAEVTCK